LTLYPKRRDVALALATVIAVAIKEIVELGSNRGGAERAGRPRADPVLVEGIRLQGVGVATISIMAGNWQFVSSDSEGARRGWA
jgi:hypothetical protein